MTVGTMYFDNDQSIKTPQKIERAMKQYEKKHGRLPNRCFTNSINFDPALEYPIKTSSAIWILVNNFWLGIE